jgi:phthalate 4,5-dioxygenase oxygenase subunit
MLSREANERLCRVGPGTPMGNMLRRYWMPICASAQLPRPDCTPLLARLMGQNFVVFRDTLGRVGVLDELCMHRGASLALGRVEECGIRCIYHGWKFGVDGAVLDIMNSPDDRVRQRLKAPAWPVREAGGIVWTYIGPAEVEPPFPRYEFMDLPDANRVVMRVDTNANWVQALEGGLDSSHVSILHSNAARPGWNGGPGTRVGSLADTIPRFEVEDTDFGYHYAAIRKSPNGEPDNVRIVPFILPSGRIIPDIAQTGNATIVFEVPIDDENTATFSVRYGQRPIERMSRVRETGFDDPEFYSDADCKFRFSRGDFAKQKRAAMDVSWSGFRGIALEDAVIVTSMGPIYDRSLEHLVAADVAVVHFRRRLFEQADRVERGEPPIGVAVDHRAVTAIDAPMPAAGHWRTLVPTHVVG